MSLLRQLCCYACITSLGCSASNPSTTQPSQPAATQAASSKPDTAPHALPSKTTLPPPLLTKSNKPIICIYHDYIANPLHGLEAVVWSDGKIVWFVGDKPLMGFTDVANINKLMTKLHEEGVFGNGRTEYEHAAADAPIEAIIVKLPDRKLILRSFHELAGQYPKLEDASQKPTEFGRFLRIWSEIRSSVKTWIPKEGIFYVGEILVDSDK